MGWYGPVHPAVGDPNRPVTGHGNSPGYKGDPQALDHVAWWMLAAPHGGGHRLTSASRGEQMNSDSDWQISMSCLASPKNQPPRYQRPVS